VTTRELPPLERAGVAAPDGGKARIEAYRVLAVASTYPAALIVMDEEERLMVYLPVLGAPTFDDLAELLLASGSERFFRRVDDPAWYSLGDLAGWSERRWARRLLDRAPR
jgi:hypothetical protein